jgi:(1->4)-alpha-D-glucan 1-alpha-D-glucosylmutase
MSDTDALLQRVRHELRRERRATYRLQLGPTLRFDDVTALVPYLVRLGVSDVYLSPCFRCGPGSSHGYDVTDHAAFNPDVGDADAFARMAAAAAAAGLGMVLDVVPNHMGVAGDSNPWWLDVLENGPASRYAAFFDIDWTPAKPELRNTVLLPVLPDQYGKVLEQGGLALEFAEGAFFVRVNDARLPVAPETYPLILTRGIDGVRQRRPDDPAVDELLSVLTAIEHLPGRAETDPARREERTREKEVVKRRLAALVKESDEIRGLVEDGVRGLNGRAGDPRSFDLLDALLEAQAYRLADWRVAGDEVNYRRFFDVNHLAAIRMETPEVFEAAHRLVFRLIGEGLVNGLRVDHPDGLYAPAEYFARLQEGAVAAVARRLDPGLEPAAVEALVGRHREAAAAGGDAARPLWIAAEKILIGDEPLPEWWSVAGTTGYDYLASVNGLAVDRGAARQMTSVYRRVVGPTLPWADVAYAGKRLIMQTTMAGEMNTLGWHLARLAARNRRSRDFTLPAMVRAVREVIACLPVYRTYVGDSGPEPSAQDRRVVERAVAEAKRRNTVINASVFDFLADVLLLGQPDGLAEADREAWRLFVGRFQQASGPVTAKGVEDTAFYVYHRLASLAEVGGDPGRFGESPATFHEKNARRHARWPESLLATTSHDTKRGEDVRARINVLSEAPADWQAALRRWRAFGRRSRRGAAERVEPSRNDLYLLYQTLVGAWPAGEWARERPDFTERIVAYMEKAIREAKVHTSWINPDPDYEEAMADWVRGLLAEGSAFVEEFLPFQARIARHGMVAGLAQTLLKLASPGIADLYQGAELWDLSLVDPDNRRPVDFAARARLLDDLAARIAAAGDDLSALVRELLESWPDGRVKLHLIHRALAFRRAEPALFVAGDYRALSPAGERAEHVVAFARRLGDRVAIAAAPRLSARLTGLGGALPIGSEPWGDTRVVLGDAAPAGGYRDWITGCRHTVEPGPEGPDIPVGRLFGEFPGALLQLEAPAT